jgi:aminopeptidase N
MIGKFAITSILMIIFIQFSPALNAQQKTVTYLYDPGSEPSEKLIDAEHLTAKISIDPWHKIVNGEADFTFKTIRTSTDSILVNATDMTVNRVTIDKKSVTFNLKDNSLVIFPGSNLMYGTEHVLHIDYRSDSPSFLYHSGWDDPSGIKRKEIWAHRPVSWLPYLDDRLTVDMFVTFNKKYKVFSNGERVEIKPEGDSLLTWHYRMNHPHPFFSTALVIGD